jgi:hypothetical protein
MFGYLYYIDVWYEGKEILGVFDLGIETGRGG